MPRDILPINGRVLVKRVEPETKTKGGLILPNASKEKPTEGVVVDAGNGKPKPDGSRSAPQLKDGDGVVFSAYAGTEMKIDGVEYLLIGEDDILAKIVERKESSCAN